MRENNVVVTKLVNVDNPEQLYMFINTLWTCNGGTYIFAQVSARMYSFINLQSGNRFGDAFGQMAGIAVFDKFTRIPSGSVLEITAG